MAVRPLEPTKLAFRGCPAVLRNRDGILICAGSGNQFNFSVDEAKTWSDTATTLDPAIGRHNHYPALLELPDGQVLSVYHVGNHWPTAAARRVDSRDVIPRKAMTGLSA